MVGCEAIMGLGGVTGGAAGGVIDDGPVGGVNCWEGCVGCVGAEGVEENEAGKRADPDVCGIDAGADGALWLENAEGWLVAPNTGVPKTDLGALPKVRPKTDVVLVEPRPPNADCVGGGAAGVVDTDGAKADLTAPFMGMSVLGAVCIGAGVAPRFDDDHSVALRVTGSGVSGAMLWGSSGASTASSA